MKLVRFLGRWSLVALAAIGLHYVGLLVGLLAFGLLCAAALVAWIATDMWNSAARETWQGAETREWVKRLKGKEDLRFPRSTRNSLPAQRILAKRRDVPVMACWAMGLWGLGWGVALFAGGRLLGEFQSFNVFILFAVALALLLYAADTAGEAMELSSSAAREAEQEEKHEWVRRMRGKKESKFLPSACRALLAQPSLALRRDAALLACWALGCWGLGWGIALLPLSAELDSLDSILGDPTAGEAILANVACVAIGLSVWSTRWVWVLLRARIGAAEAKYRLGRRYDRGSGVRQNFSKAARWYRKAAQLGHANAQERLSIMHSLGLGLREDPAEADYWLCKAAEQYDADALCRLAKMCESRKGVPKDKCKAARLFRKAAEQGHDEAQYRLAKMYRSGKGLPKDKGEAARWFRKAAEQGHDEAQYRLAKMYRSGKGLPKDKGEAARWFRKAAEEGHAGAQYSLGEMYDKGDGVPEDKVEAARWYIEATEFVDQDSPFVDELARDRLNDLYFGHLQERCEAEGADAVRWHHNAAKEGDEDVQYGLGIRYCVGDGVSTDYAQAARWFERAAEQGHADSQYRLGVMYADGKGVPEDECLAYAWLNIASDQDHESAQQAKERLESGMTQEEIEDGQALRIDPSMQYRFGFMHENIYRLSMWNQVTAAQWYRRAARQGHVLAQNRLGEMYLDGQGVSEDRSEAARWFRRAADQGHPHAQAWLGAFCVDGEVVPQSFAEAAQWYRKAAAQGLASAQYHLGLMYREGQGVVKDRTEAARWFRQAAEQGHSEAQSETQLTQ